MPCYHPIDAFQCADGSVIFSERKGDVIRPLQLPCGQCVGCRLERSRQWAVRCMHEASLWPASCFVTLTYDNEHLPDDGSLHYEHVQLFMKRLRKRLRGCGPAPDQEPSKPFPIRFYMCGEYGEKFGRPHYHLCLFNCHFGDRVPWRKAPSGSILYRSAILEELWPFGFSSIGDLTFESAAYVARYCMKKITGHRADEHYRRVDEDGVITQLVPEFNKMSLKPGIGALWLDRYTSDVYPSDEVIVRGKSCKPPRYYDKRFSSQHPEIFDDIAWQRVLDSIPSREHSTDERLAVRETVAKSRCSLTSRSLE